MTRSRTLIDSRPMSDINKDIEGRVSAFVSELTDLIRQAAVAEVAEVLGAGKATPARAVAAKAPSAKRAGTRGRRTPEQIGATLETIIAYIKSNPNTRSEKIRKALKLPTAVMHDALTRLRDAKKLKMKGVKRAATYTAP